MGRVSLKSDGFRGEEGVAAALAGAPNTVIEEDVLRFRAGSSGDVKPSPE